MRDVNKVILIGRLGANPVQRQTKNGIPVVHFPVATTRRTRPPAEVEAEREARPAGAAAGAGGASEAAPEIAEETQWHRIVAWGRQGQVCAEYLRKGSSVYVEGSVRTRKFEGKDGDERIAFEVHAEEVSFLGGRGGKVNVERVAEAAASPALN